MLVHSGTVYDDSGDRFRAQSYICCPSNCCNHSSVRKFVCAGAQKGVWGCRSAELEPSSLLPSDPVILIVLPMSIVKTKEISVVALLRFEFAGTS